MKRKLGQIQKTVWLVSEQEQIDRNNGSHYKVSEWFLVFFCMYVNRKEKEEEGGQNNRPTNLPKVITFSTDYKYTT